MSSWLLRRRLAWSAAAIVVVMAIAAAGWSWRARRNDTDLLKSALRLIDRNDPQAAIPLLDKILSHQPSHGQALLYRGQLARDSGDLAAAVRYWNRVPDNPPREGGTARFLEGTLHLDANRARDAEAAWLKSIELHPDYLQPHERLLKLYSTQLRAADALRELETVGRFRPWTYAELYQHTGAAGKFTDNDKNIARVEEYVAADADDIHSLVALAQLYLWEESCAEAATLVQRALSGRPGNPALYSMLAEAQLGQFDLAGARAALAQAPLEPAAPLCVWKAHGLYWMEVGEWNRAAICLRRAVALGAGDRGTAFKLGQVLERAGDASAAQDEFQRARKLLRLHSVMFGLTQAADAAHASVAALGEAGELLLQLNHPVEAAEFFKRVLSQNPELSEAQRAYERAVKQSRLQKSPVTNDHILAAQVAADAAAVGNDLQLANDEGGATRHGAGTSADGERNRPEIRLVDHHVAAGIEFQFFNGDSGLKYLLETTGGGVAVLDYDGDGWPDLYFPQGGPIPIQEGDATYTDRLYRNLGNGIFADVTLGMDLYEGQFSQGCAAGDYDNDGFPDLAVANFGANVIFHNHGDGTFGDVTAGCGIAGKHYSTSLGWSDLDGDGNLDLFVVNYVRNSLQVCYRTKDVVATCHPQAFAAESDNLYVNLGDGTFADMTHAAGIIDEHGRGLGLVIADFDGDGRPDVYVANDGTRSFLFRNLAPADGQRLDFEEIGLSSGTAVNAEGQATAAMGIACGDLDGDGRLDLYVTNFRGEADILYLNRGEMIFEDLTRRAGLVEATRPMLGWGTQTIDLDLDGRPEIFLTNGHLDDRRDDGIPWKMPSQLFYNIGGGMFADVSRGSGGFFAQECLGRGVARLDWDRDGRHDLVVVYHDRPVALLRNEAPARGHRLIVQLHGVQSNRDAIGARLRTVCDGRAQVVEVCGGDGYCASNEKRQIVGLGSSTKIDELEIRWPHGRRDVWADIPADSELILIEGQPPRIKGLAAP